MKRIIAILVVSINLGPCFSLADDDKNYRLSFIAAFDYSFNKYPINASYTFDSDPQKIPLNMTLTAAGKPAFGEGIRLEYKFKSKMSYAISAMMLDKGYRIYQEGSINNRWNISKYNTYNKVYLSVPVEVIYKIGKVERPIFIKSGISFDLNFQSFTNHKPIASSFILGVGKSFCINEILWISIEPTMRYAMYNYGDHVQMVPDRFDNYRPVSVGFMISLSQ